MREVFGRAAWFARTPLDFARQLSRALDGDVRRQALGRRIAGQHSWDATAAAHLALYRCAVTPPLL